MRDERDGPLVLDEARPASRAGYPAGATIIPFPYRASKPLQQSHMGPAARDAAVRAVLARIDATLNSKAASHAPTVLAALGALSGFAVQQSLLVQGGATWAQPKRAEHLDRMLLSESARDGSIWHTLRTAAGLLGSQHLPDPNKLLQSTLRCVGTTQFGMITLPLEYKLMQQPQASLMELWAPVCAGCDTGSAVGRELPSLLGAVCARRLSLDQRRVPPHVALRILMQAALAMALIEPRVVPGATLRPTA